MPETENPNGFLNVFVTTARGSVPVPDAVVRISGKHTDDIVRFTDRDGRTERISLPAPAGANSESADMENPFYDYRVTVYKEGFYRHIVENVPVFPGIVSTQTVDLIGLSDINDGSLIPEEGIMTVPDNPQVLDRVRPTPPRGEYAPEDSFPAERESAEGPADSRKEPI